MSGPLLRAAVIGLGVGERHIEGYEADPRCQVVSLCDTDPDKLVQVGARHPGCSLTSDPDEILADTSIDVVSIASPDRFHHAQIMAALASGKHIFIEKPLCMHDNELVDIRRALVAQPSLKMSSNLILRRSPRFARLRQRLQAGEMGTPYYSEADYNYGRLEKITGGWRGQQPFYSVVHGGAIHMIDLLIWLMGEKPLTVTALGNAIATKDTAFRFNDCVVALLKFPSQAIAKVSANFGCVFPHHHNLTVYGTKATFVHDQQGARLFTSRDPDAAPLAITDAYRGAAKGDMVPNFVASILDGTEPDVSASDVLDVMAVSLAIEKSAKLEEPVKVCFE
jgi:predicted dehydrogenase